MKNSGEVVEHVSTVMFFANDDAWTYNLRKELIGKLVEEKLRVILVFPYGPRVEYFKELGCEYRDVPMLNRQGKNPLRDIRLFLEYLKLLKEYRPAAALTYTIKPNVYGSLACGIRGVPCFPNVTGLGAAVENHGFMQKLATMLYRIGLRRAEKVFVQNSENLDYLLKTGIIRGKYELIPGSGVNLDQYHLMEYPHGETVDFLFVARIRKEKGIDQYLDAAKVIREKYPYTRFHVCGACEGDYQGVLDELTQAGVILYHGSVKDMTMMQKISSCTVHPTYYPEGMSNVLLESCASGRPIITTDRPGCREIVEDHVNGLVVKERDSDDLIGKIEEFLSLSWEERKAMGLAGRKKMENEFDRNLVINAYLKEIRRFTETGRE